MNTSQMTEITADNDTQATLINLKLNISDQRYNLTNISPLLPYIIRTIKVNMSINGTTAIRTNLTYELANNTAWAITCNLFSATSITGNSTQFNITYTGFPLVVQNIYTFTSGTTLYAQGALGASILSVSTATITNNIPTITRYESIVYTGANNSNVTVWVRGEQILPYFEVFKGSYCKYENLTYWGI